MPTLANGTKEHFAYEVVICGAGPVGLILALFLHERGIKVGIFDRQPSLYPLPRAVALDHEGQRILWSAGLGKRLEPFLQDVCEDPTKSFHWRDADGEIIVNLAWDDESISGFNRVSGFSQPQIQLQMEKAVEGAGIVIHRNLELQSMHQDAEHVYATFKGWPTEDVAPETTITSQYFVGADGANSTVRSLCNMSVTDLGFSEDWLVADLIPLNDYVPPIVEKYQCSQFCNPDRPTTLVFSGPGRKRIEFMRLPEKETKEDLFNDKMAWKLVGDWGYDPSNCQLERTALYTFRARWADNWRNGRVLLAGDACHQMPPFIGQGMNSGLRDAAALGWRLPLVVKGAASPDLLDTYSSERVPHCQAITKHCIMLGEVICMRDHAAAKQVHAALRANPPPDGFDPPLGPGVFTTQPCAGHLGLQRRVKGPDGREGLFDSIFGVGFKLITKGPEIEAALAPKTKAMFEQRLSGQVLNLTPEVDVQGAYAKWLEELEADAVLIRPDFYVFGTAKVEGVEALVEDLGQKMKLTKA